MDLSNLKSRARPVASTAAAVVAVALVSEMCAAVRLRRSGGAR